MATLAISQDHAIVLAYNALKYWQENYIHPEYSSSSHAVRSHKDWLYEEFNLSMVVNSHNSMIFYQDSKLLTLFLLKFG